MTDEHDDRIFNYLSARVSSRESASISVVSLASASSLVFLGFMSTTGNFLWEFFFIGILFPALAFAYNEITNRGLHQDDQKAINDLIKKTNPERWKNETEQIIKNTNKRYLRRVLMRFGFLSPILGWIVILPNQFQLDLYSKIIFDVIFGVAILGISIRTAYKKEKLEYEK